MRRFDLAVRTAPKASGGNISERSIWRVHSLMAAVTSSTPGASMGIGVMVTSIDYSPSGGGKDNNG